jgi:N,N'-diacetyllegionaminate synthase
MNQFIIAEIGVNHDGKYEKAIQLIDHAIAAGADAVKFQSFAASRLSTHLAPKVDYQNARDSHSSHFEMLRNLELSFEEQSRLKEYCDNSKIEFISTPYGLEDAKFLNSIGVTKFKVASADVVDIPLHELIASFGKLTIASTGMATRSEIERIYEIYLRFETPLVLMHTTSEYPSSLVDANLIKIEYLKSLHPFSFGYSDHTTSSLCASMAVAMGCSYFEKHLTSNKDDDGPDHAASLDPAEFKNYVRSIREAGLALGSVSAGRTVKEEQMALVSRKSLHYKVGILQGVPLTEEDLILLRPGDGVLWDARSSVIGKKLVRNVDPGEQLRPEDLI